MSTGNISRVMGTYFAALGSGHFQQLLTEDVTWTTIQGGTEIKGSQAVEESVSGLRSRMFGMQTRQLAVTDGSAYVEGSRAGQDRGARVPYCVAYDPADGRIAAIRAYGEIPSLMQPSEGAGREAPVE